MKNLKSSISLVIITFAIIFTSCVDTVTVPPTVTVNTPTTDTTEVYIGTSLDFKVDLSSESGLLSFKTLSSSISGTVENGNVEYDGELTATQTVTVTLDSTTTDGEIIKISFIVTDEDGQNTAQKIIKAVKKSTLLSDAKEFEWKRVGGEAATGMEAFGLSWTSNTTESAVIKKGANKFVELDANAWATITTLEDLVTAIDNANDIEKWEKVSATLASSTYDFTLGTITGENYYIIHVTSSAVTVTDAGTTITIGGQYKE